MHYFASMNYIVTKSTKSKGLAIMLVALFGPIGMFYSTIKGAITMLLAGPALIVLIIFKIINKSLHEGFMPFIIIYCFLAYITCFVWAYIAVSDYNRRILSEADNNMEFGGDNSDYTKKSSSIIIVLITAISILLFAYFTFNQTTSNKEKYFETPAQPEIKINKKVPSITSKKRPSKKSRKIVQKGDMYYTGEWQNSELSIDDYVWKLSLEESSKVVTGRMDKYHIKGRVKEYLEFEEDIIRRELIGHLFDNQNNKLADISIDLSGDYENTWNEKITLTIKKTYNGFDFVDNIDFYR